MRSNRSGLRELQIAKGLITLRWASIPIIFGFSLISRNLFGMSFQIAPIYVLCCVLALLNVFFTVHFSALSRQMVLTKGLSGLKRYLVFFISRHLHDLREKGIKSLAAIPIGVLKLFSILYLMLLEALKDVSFNLLSLKNVMHTQVIFDLLIITLLTRFTGTTESPMTYLAVVPVVVAGSVMGFRTGGIYSFLTVAAYITTSLLVSYKVLPHIKFYSPSFGDLSQCTGWIASNAFIMLIAFSATTYLAHKLTSVFKERIYFLNDLLYKSRTKAISSTFAAEQTSAGWMILDSEGNVERVKIDRNGILPSDLAGKNVFKVIPEMEQYGIGYLMQSVYTGGNKRSIDKVKITSKEGTEHRFSCKLFAFSDCDETTKILMVIEEQTETLYLRKKVESLKKEIAETRINLERTSLENKENRQAYEETLKTANERAIEIEILNQKVREMNENETNQANKISSLMAEVASLKSANDELTSDLKYKQMILDEISELLNVCDKIEDLTSLIESKARTLFKLDNTCLHVFNSSETPMRVNEILDTRKASPRLLDLPRRNPSALNPVLNEGRPVVVQAQINNENSASMSISNGSMHRLVAYVPVRHEGKILGMMMLERFGQEENPEAMIKMLNYYLKHSAATLKAAISNKELQDKNLKLNSTIAYLHTQLDSIKTMVTCDPEEDMHPFGKLIFELGKFGKVQDAILVRTHNDESFEVLSRLDKSKQLELNQLEEKVFETIKENPNHKATINEREEDKVLNAFPLKNGNRLLGALLIYTPEGMTKPETRDLIDFTVRLIRDRISLYIMNEEKELWENFYRENLSA